MIVGWLLFAAVLFAVDVLLKQAIEERLKIGEERDILGGKVVVRRVHNKGMLLNALENYPKAIAFISAILGIVILLYDAVLVFKKKNHMLKAGMMFLTGGAFSNIFDRLVRGKVVDYFGFHTGREKFDRVTFNLGDLFIIAGALLASVGNLLKK